MKAAKETGPSGLHESNNYWAKCLAKEVKPDFGSLLCQFNFIVFQFNLVLFHFFFFKDKQAIMEEHQRQLSDREVSYLTFLSCTFLTARNVTPSYCGNSRHFARTY